jgi:hypothetical protein
MQDIIKPFSWNLRWTINTANLFIAHYNKLFKKLEELQEAMKLIQELRVVKGT